MIKKLALLFFLTCCITGCISPKCCKTLPPSCPITKCYKLAAFDSVVISGSAHVVMTNGANEIILNAKPEDIAVCKMYLKNHTLYIAVPANLAANVHIKIEAPCLKNITVAEYAEVDIENFSNPNLTVKAKDYASIELKGNIGLAKVIQRGAGKIDIRWVNSNKLMIDSTDNGPIYLAGTANNMLVKLSGPAHLDARYLRTHKVIVIATDTAEAYVLPLNSFSAYASSHSNIYYYKRPKKITIVTKDSGNVLHPDWIQ